MTLPRLRHNIAALGLVQLGNYLVPLLTLPYLTRVLGAEGFGRVVFVQGVIAFLILLVDFGFSWSTTRHIAAHRSDRQEVSRVFFATWIVQWVLVVLAAALMWALSICVPAIEVDASLYVWGFGMVIGHALFPLWLLQGLEQMRSVAVIQLGSRVLSLPLLFVFVKQPEDVVMAVGFYSVVALLAGILSIFAIVRMRVVDWCQPTILDLVAVFREGAGLFFSRISISLYTSLIPIAIGSWAGHAQLAYFNLADRLRMVVSSIIAPVLQALFPRMSLLYQSDPSSANRLAVKVAMGVCAVTLGAGALMWLLAGYIMQVFGGAGFQEAVPVLRWLAFVPCVVALSNLLGVQVMLPQGMNKPFSTILTMASVLSLLLMHPLIHSWQALGAAQLIFIVEVVVTVSMALYLRFVRKTNVLG